MVVSPAVEKYGGSATVVRYSVQLPLVMLVPPKVHEAHVVIKSFPSLKSSAMPGLAQTLNDSQVVSLLPPALIGV